MVPLARSLKRREARPACKRRNQTLFKLLFSRNSDPGIQNAAVTANISADDGRANTLVRRESALGLTERLT